MSSPDFFVCFSSFVFVFIFVICIIIVIERNLQVPYDFGYLDYLVTAGRNMWRILDSYST